MPPTESIFYPTHPPAADSETGVSVHTVDLESDPTRGVGKWDREEKEANYVCCEWVFTADNWEPSEDSAEPTRVKPHKGQGADACPLMLIHHQLGLLWGLSTPEHLQPNMCTEEKTLRQRITEDFVGM